MSGGFEAVASFWRVDSTQAIHKLIWSHVTFDRQRSSFGKFQKLQSPASSKSSCAAAKVWKLYVTSRAASQGPAPCMRSVISTPCTMSYVMQFLHHVRCRAWCNSFTTCDVARGAIPTPRTMSHAVRVVPQPQANPRCDIFYVNF